MVDLLLQEKEDYVVDIYQEMIIEVDYLDLVEFMILRIKEN